MEPGVVPSPESQGRDDLGSLNGSVGTDPRQPDTAINVLNSQYPEPGGTVPDLRLTNLNLHCLFIPPRGQLHTAEPSVSSREVLGGIVTLP